MKTRSKSDPQSSFKNSKPWIPILASGVLIAFMGFTPQSFGGGYYKGGDYAPVEAFKYGVGPYGAIQGGANLYQSYEGTQRATVGGRSVALEVKEKLGGFVGLKLGYGFDGGVVRPAIELDAFYNAADFKVEGRVDGKVVAKGTGRFDTGAFLVNGLLRFDLGGPFMPYLGAGAGFWFGQVDDARLTVVGGPSIKGDDTSSGAGFAAQGLGGFDYWFSEKLSAFTEYKFLNYFGSDLPTSDTVSQHLLGVGLRMNF